MKTARIAIILICAATGLGWGIERSRVAHLQQQLADRQREEATLRHLQREHDRLQSLQPTEEELDRLRLDTTARELSAAAALAKPAKPPPAPIRALEPGTWAQAAAWKNCGRATPEAALETMLWAAAGGELGELKDVLEFDDASRVHAAAMLANLPEPDRRQYATLEDLLALVVAGNVPLDSAQIVARQHVSENEALEYVRLKDSAGVTRQVCLTLHRTPGGWKLRVPGETVKALTKLPPLPPPR